MKQLPLGSDTTLLFALVVGFLVVLLIVTSGLLFINVKKFQRLRGQRRQTLATFAQYSKALDPGIALAGRILLWLFLTLSLMSIIALMFYNEGFVDVSYDEQHIEINYRMPSSSASIPWENVRDIKIIERTYRSYKTNWIIEITTIDGTVYRSIVASARFKSKTKLLHEAASLLQKEWNEQKRIGAEKVPVQVSGTLNNTTNQNQTPNHD